MGIIDIGFDKYSQMTLPTPAAVRCYIPRADANDDPLYISALLLCGVSQHGTAVTEALLDVAPDVTVYLASIVSPGDLKHAVAWQVDQEVDIINHSVAWAWDGPKDGTSLYADSTLRTVDYAVQKRSSGATPPPIST